MADSTQLKTQVAVIGAGPGGYVAAIRLAQLGKQVVLIEKENLGGVCLNWGCIPSKAMIHAAKLYETIQKASLMGIHVDNVYIDPIKVQDWKESIVLKLTGGIGQLMKSHGVQVISGAAQFTDAQTLKLTGAGTMQTLRAEHFLIATGTVPASVPGLDFDGEAIIESRDALALKSIPARMAVVGGGVIGLELGMLYNKLGSQITLIEKLPQLLTGTDADILQQLERTLKKRKIKVMTGTGVKTAAKLPDGGGVRLSLEGPGGDQTLDVDKVLVAVGRKPHTDGLGLQQAGVALADKGFIQVNARMQTSVPHIFAIGDVTGPPLLAHKASKEGLVAAAVIAGQSEIVDYRAMPAAIFSDPEIATVGLSELQAQEQGIDIKVGKFPFQASGRAMSLNETEGFVKVIAEAGTNRVLGVHMIGPDVSELLGEATLAIEMGASTEDMALTVHTHPTLSETLMEASESIQQRAIHIFQSPLGADKGKTPSMLR